MKKLFFPHKIGRFLGKNRVKNIFFYVNLSKNNKNNNKIKIFIFLIIFFLFFQKYLEKLVWSRTDRDSFEICELSHCKNFCNSDFNGLSLIHKYDIRRRTVY